MTANSLLKYERRYLRCVQSCCHHGIDLWVLCCSRNGWWLLYTYIGTSFWLRDWWIFSFLLRLSEYVRAHETKSSLSSHYWFSLRCVGYLYPYMYQSQSIRKSQEKQKILAVVDKFQNLLDFSLGRYKLVLFFPFQQDSIEGERFLRFCWKVYFLRKNLRKQKT